MLRNHEKTWEIDEKHWKTMRNGEKWLKRWETMRSDEKQRETMGNNETQWETMRHNAKRWGGEGKTWFGENLSPPRGRGKLCALPNACFPIVNVVIIPVNDFIVVIVFCMVCLKLLSKARFYLNNLFFICEHFQTEWFLFKHSLSSFLSLI